MSENVMVPVDFSNPVNDVDGSGRGGVPFATYYSSKSERMAENLPPQLPGLKDGDVVLIRPEPESPQILRPAKLHILSARQYGVESTDEGQLVRVVFGRPDFGDKELNETIETVVIVYGPNDTLTPARFTFRGTKAGAGVVLSKAIDLASKPGWALESPEHAQSMRAPWPSLRFVGTLGTSPRTSKSSGRKYLLGTASVRPTTAAELNMVAAAIKDAGFNKALKAVLDSHNRRVAVLDEFAEANAPGDK